MSELPEPDAMNPDHVAFAARVVLGYTPNSEPTHGHCRLPRGLAVTGDRVADPTCAADGCERGAVTWLRFRGMGDHLHVHVCASCEAIDREFADVIESGPLPCPDRLLCTAQPVLTATPPLLPEDEL